VEKVLTLTFSTFESMLNAAMAKRRIDTLLVARGLAESREKARIMVMEGAVVADNRTIVKTGTLVDEDAEVRLLQSPKFVSRGGLKLEHALAQFQLDVNGLVAVDIGASTGGFTDCLLQGGARKVYAVDVGYGQLDYRLRQNPRVVVMERVNARYAFTLPEPVDLATVDVSFISLEKVVPTVAGLVKSGSYLIVLVKPQFEVGKGQVGKGGLVKDPLVHATVLGRFIAWAVDHGLRLGGLVASPILGAEGNKEFLLLLWKPYGECNDKEHMRG
jgi:23S rRNA (cytidine1920-2'-O)/16S rRNA (cytidine1409-2'-O)-methyltransferase